MADFRNSKWVLLAVLTYCCVTSPADALPQFSNLRVLKSGWKEWRHLIDNLVPESETGRKGSEASNSITSLLHRLYVAKKTAKTIRNNSPIRVRINPEFLTSTTTTTTTTTTAAPKKLSPVERRRSSLSKLPNSPIYYIHLPSKYFITGRNPGRKDVINRKDDIPYPIYVATTISPESVTESSVTTAPATVAPPTRHPVTNSRIIRIKGPYIFNGKPGGIYSAPAPNQPPNYWDMLHTLYPKLKKAQFIR